MTWFSLRVISEFARAPDAAWKVYRTWQDTESQMRNVRIAGVLSRRLNLKNSPESMHDTIAQVYQWPMLTTASLIGSPPTITLYLFLQRFYFEGLARGTARG